MQGSLLVADLFHSNHWYLIVVLNAQCVLGTTEASDSDNEGLPDETKGKTLVFILDSNNGDTTSQEKEIIKEALRGKASQMREAKGDSPVRKYPKIKVIHAEVR